MMQEAGWRPALLLLALLPVAAAVEDLTPRLEGDSLRVWAPGLRLLEGEALRRLKDGSTVAYTFQLALLDHASRTVERRSFEEFVFSYDLWEEKFSVAARSGGRRPGSYLGAVEAQKWCFDNLALDAEGLDPARSYLLRLEIRAEPRMRDPLLAGDGLSLKTLVEIFSRPPASRQQAWRVESRPFQLIALRQEAVGRFWGGRRRLP